MQAKPPLFRQVMRFCIGGAAGVIASYIALYCLTEYLKIWYIVSAVIGFIVNRGLNFYIQRRWTFQNKDSESAPKQLVQYFTMAACFLIGNTALMYCLVNYLHLWYMGAQVILTIFFTILSFIISRRIFTNRRSAT